MKRTREENSLQEAVHSNEPVKKVRRLLQRGYQVTSVPVRCGGPNGYESARAVALTRQWKWFQERAFLLHKILEASWIPYPLGVVILHMSSGQMISFYEVCKIIDLANASEQRRRRRINE